MLCSIELQFTINIEGVQYHFLGTRTSTSTTDYPHHAVAGRTSPLPLCHIRGRGGGVLRSIFPFWPLSSIRGVPSPSLSSSNQETIFPPWCSVSCKWPCYHPILSSSGHVIIKCYLHVAMLSSNIILKWPCSYQVLSSNVILQWHCYHVMLS